MLHPSSDIIYHTIPPRLQLNATVVGVSHVYGEHLVLSLLLVERCGRLVLCQ